eukprot:625731_1
MTFSVLLLSLIAHVLFALDCERVELHSEGLIIPTTYCYAGSFSANSITYSSTSFMYQCIDGTPYYVEYTNAECEGEGTKTSSTSFMYQCVSGTPYYVEYTNAECEGEGTKTSVKDNDDYSYWCGIDQCDVVHLTLYDGVSNEDCVKAEHDAALLDSYERFSGAFLLDYCNYMSDAMSLKLTCAGDEAKLLAYGLSDCKGPAATTLMDTSVAVNCNTTTQALGTLSALTAQCEIHSKNSYTVIIIVVVAVVVLIAVGIAVYCYFKKKKEADDDKYSHLVGDQPDAAENDIQNQS